MEYTSQSAALFQLGSGLTLISGEYTGAENAIGSFSGLNVGTVESQPITLEAGLVLTTGNGNVPLSNTSSALSVQNATAGYAPLETLLSGAGVDSDDI